MAEATRLGLDQLLKKEIALDKGSSLEQHGQFVKTQVQECSSILQSPSQPLCLSECTQVSPQGLIASTCLCLITVCDLGTVSRLLAEMHAEAMLHGQLDIGIDTSCCPHAPFVALPSEALELIADEGLQ